MNLITDRIQFESDRRLIKKILSARGALTSVTSANTDEVNLYEHVENLSPNFDNSSLVLIAYNQKTCLQIGFTSFGKKNIWHDALQSSLLFTAPSSSKKQTSSTILNGSDSGFRCLSLDKVLKPFLELCDTIVNSYSFISESLIALACDDGLYVLNQTSNDSSRNISLVKINSIESAHKLSYQPEFGKLCLIARKSRQFLSIDIGELMSATLAMANSTSLPSQPSLVSDEDEFGDDNEDKSINVKIEHIQNIDRCHLFESSFSKPG